MGGWGEKRAIYNCSIFHGDVGGPKKGKKNADVWMFSMTDLVPNYFFKVF